ncbi:MAG: tRNA uridine-5-carboxymethylaminomethyl(34) synthesis enzyme MnmG [Candidatus Bipolaricaulota bacterium]
MKHYDVVVVGAGHAGCEAAHAAARLGATTALVTINLSEVGRMPCNPSIGGPGKSQLVTELDALGGMMARLTDETMIHVRLLNTSKGKAMQVRRAQVDRIAYKQAWKRVLEATDGLDLIEGMVDEIVVRGGRAVGVRLREALELSSSAVVLAAGTFLNGRVLLGDVSYPAGRAGEPPSERLAEALRSLGLRMERLKTGTPPRVHRRSLDVGGLERQATSSTPLALSFSSAPRILPDDCPVYVTHTNADTHRIIRENLQESAIFNGLMSGTGPRHCPSLESKIVKFPDRDRHKVFLEPEGKDTAEIYLQGIYTAFSPSLQERVVRSIEGLERATIERYGYNIEYDFVDPLSVSATLETRRVPGLFLCGQVIGTTGYEEAAVQGFLAGVNAVRKLRGESGVVLSRGEAVIGVLVDDLVAKGVTEPYRMLPSRCEHRVRLREQNADLRLAELGHALGLTSEADVERSRERRRAMADLHDRLKRERMSPDDPRNEQLAARGTRALTNNGASLFELLVRPEVQLADLVPLDGIPESVRSEVEIEAKYAGYIAQHEAEVARMSRLDAMSIPDEIDYGELTALSFEGRHLLSRARPRSFGQASRVPGVSQADLAMLAVLLRR